jgi:hypothetical protein
MVNERFSLRLSVTQFLNWTATALEVRENAPIDFNEIRPKQLEQLRTSTNCDPLCRLEASEVAHIIDHQITAGASQLSINPDIVMESLHSSCPCRGF